MRRVCVAILVCLSCTACFRATTTITVRADGSGVIDQDVSASAQALALMRGFAGGGIGGQDKSAPEAAIFGPEQAQKLASSMGVRFVSGEPIKTADQEGYRAHYTFDDVTKVRLSMNQDPTAAGVPSQPGGTPPFGFEFSRTNDGSTLTVRMPEQKPNQIMPQFPGAGSDAQNNAQALAVMSAMMRGLFVDVTLAVDGRVVKTNAPYVNGSKITLVQLDFDTLLASNGGLEKLQKISDPKLLKDIPGVKVVTEPAISVEFVR
jgi:hypothetical protein